MVAGPGLIVMVADNDAGAVSTYTQAGAQYGTSLLWVLLLLLPVTYFVQEMVARLGIATGQGHAAMIYQRFGKWWGRFSLVDLLLVNFLTLVTEFAAIALAARHLGLAPSVVVPLAAVGLILLVGTGSYRRWERMTLVLCGLNLAWLCLAALVGPNWGSAATARCCRACRPAASPATSCSWSIAIVGTTIAPWQLFFQQSCVADKRLRFADLQAGPARYAGRRRRRRGVRRLHDAGRRRAASQWRAAIRIRRRWRMRWRRSIGHRRTHADPAADVQRGPAGRHRHLAVVGLGLGRGDGLAQHVARPHQPGAAFLRCLRRCAWRPRPGWC